VVTVPKGGRTTPPVLVGVKELIDVPFVYIWGLL